jgi:hypothetical protein
MPNQLRIFEFLGRPQRSEKISSPNEPNQRLAQPTKQGPGEFVEVAMTTVFSFTFGAVFLAFILTALVGHALLLGAIVRPFLGKLAVTKPALPGNLQAAR